MAILVHYSLTVGAEGKRFLFSYKKAGNNADHESAM